MSSSRAQIEIGPTDRILIVGRVGSGKSVLARAMFNGSRALVVIDPKHEEELARGVVARSPSEFRQLYPQKSTRVVYRPDPEDRRSSDLDEVIRRILRYGNTRILLHETVDYAKPTYIVPALRRAIKTGRTLGVPVVSLSQRPIGLHNDVISEADHIFIFDLALSGDREKLAGVAGEGVLERIGRPFEFLYFGPSTAGDVVRCPPIQTGSSPAPAQLGVEAAT